MQRNVWILAAVAAHLAVLGASHAQERNPVRRAPSAAANAVSGRVIVKLKPSATAANGRVPALAADDRVAALAARARLPARRDRALGAGLHVLDLDPAQPVEQQLARLRADTDVEYAEPDRRRYAHAVPNDPLYAQQWYLQSDAATPSAVNAQQAWDTTTGSDAIVIAVLDTGVRYDHPDLGRVGEGGRLLAGYDFISDPAVANDGDGRDADASDPGDFVTQTDAGTQKFSGCGGVFELVARHARGRDHRREREQRASASAARRGTRGFCRSACSASAAASTRTFSRAWSGPRGFTSPGYRTIRTRRASRT